MTREEFNVFIDIIYRTGTAAPIISTGLFPIDPTVEELKVSRAIEILQKMINIDDFHAAESRLLQPILDLGDLEELSENLTRFWAFNHPGLQR